VHCVGQALAMWSPALRVKPSGFSRGGAMSGSIPLDFAVAYFSRPAG
jgi:hypothetical protein